MKHGLGVSFDANAFEEGLKCVYDFVFLKGKIKENLVCAWCWVARIWFAKDEAEDGDFALGWRECVV